MLKENRGLSRRSNIGHRAVARRDADIREINSGIGGMLREYYEDIVSEGIPPRFLELLKRLENMDQFIGGDRPHDRNEGVQGRAAGLDS